MTVQLNFDASTVDPVVAFEAIPQDDYVVALTKAEPEATKAGDAHYLHQTFTVLEGKYKGRTLHKNLNLWNPSDTAKEIAWRELSGLCHAAGVLQVATVDQLFGIPVVAKVIVENDAKYGATNRVKAFSKVTTGPGAPPAPGAPVGGPNAPDAGAPWNQPATPAPAAATPAPVGAPPAATPAAPPWGAPGAQPAAPVTPPAPAPAAPAEAPVAAPVAAPAAAPPWAGNAEAPAAPSATPPWQAK